MKKLPTIKRLLICSGLAESGGKFLAYIAPLSRNSTLVGKTSGREASFTFFIPNIREYGDIRQVACRSLAFSWFRAKQQIRRTALTNLCLKTNILAQTERVGDYVEKLIEHTQIQLSFLQLDPRDTFELSKTKHVSHDSTDDTWKAMSKKIAEQARPGLMRTDENLLLILLCFFNEQVSLDVLSRGASSRRRWTRQGENENTGPSSMGLATDLQLLLSDHTRLDIAAHELEKHSAITKNNETYTVISVIRNHIIDQLPHQLHSFWRLQALIISYRAVPWKHLEPMYVFQPYSLYRY
jgi:hypothetical protein